MHEINLKVLLNLQTIQVKNFSKIITKDKNISEKTIFL